MFHRPPSTPSRCTASQSHSYSTQTGTYVDLKPTKLKSYTTNLTIYKHIKEPSQKPPKNVPKPKQNNIPNPLPNNPHRNSMDNPPPPLPPQPPKAPHKRANTHRLHQRKLHDPLGPRLSSNHIPQLEQHLALFRLWPRRRGCRAGTWRWCRRGGRVCFSVCGSGAALLAGGEARGEC